MDRMDLTGFAPRVLSILRMMTALLFIQHGTMKLFGFPMASPGGLPSFGSMFFWVGVLELVGGILVLLGLFTRITAFVLSGLMAVAYFMAHAPQSFYPLNNQGELAILFCFVFFYFIFAGPGPWSIDAARGGED